MRLKFQSRTATKEAKPQSLPCQTVSRLGRVERKAVCDNETHTSTDPTSTGPSQHEYPRLKPQTEPKHTVSQLNLYQTLLAVVDTTASPQPRRPTTPPPRQTSQTNANPSANLPTCWLRKTFRSRPLTRNVQHDSSRHQSRHGGRVESSRIWGSQLAFQRRARDAEVCV